MGHNLVKHDSNILFYNFQTILLYAYWILVQNQTSSTKTFSVSPSIPSSHRAQHAAVSWKAARALNSCILE